MTLSLNFTPDFFFLGGFPPPFPPPLSLGSYRVLADLLRSALEASVISYKWARLLPPILTCLFAIIAPLGMHYLLTSASLPTLPLYPYLIINYHVTSSHMRTSTYRS